MKVKRRAAVMAPDFLENNFLSNEKRCPLTKIETNSARAFATNAKAGHVWDNFPSLTYKQLSPVDELEFFNPFDEAHPIKFKPNEKDVAPGYYRMPSLVSVWSSAPLFHNNALGKFTGDPSVAGRMDAFSCTSRSSIKSMTVAAKSVNAAFRIGAYVRLGVDDTERSQVKSIRGPQGPFGPIIPLRRGTILVP
jgi:hypothetical protein